MPRSPIFIALGLLTAFVAGVTAGDYLGNAAKAPRASEVSAPGNSKSSANVGDWSGRELEELGLKSQEADVKKQLADLKAKEDAMILDDRLAFYKKYSLAPESFGESLQVTDAMASFLKMSDTERKSVEDHLAQVHTQIQALAKQHLKLVTQTDTSVKYEIEPFPEGGALKDQLKQLVEGDLGTDRGDLFLASAGWEMNSTFMSFGTGKTGLELTRIDQSGPPSYRITTTYANGGSMTQSSGNTFPAEFNGLVQLDANP